MVFGLVLLASAARAENVGYVTVSGTQFVLEGSPYAFAGVNYWQGINLGMADTNGGNRARLCRELDQLKALGIVNLRVMAASEGPDTEPYRMVPSLQPAPGIFSEPVFEGLDFLLHEMNRRNMRAVMQLNNYWHWSGGMAQYVAWVEESAIPYPPSYPDFTGNWWTFMNYAARFYTNAQCQAAFLTTIAAVIGRTNRFSGVLYAEDPTVFSWELANEPRLYPGVWIDETAAFIKSLDARHMVTCGSEGEMGGDFMETHDGAQIDYATCHIWPQNWGWYDPATPEEDYHVAVSNALAYLDAHASMAQVLNKPLVLEEFGLARDGGSFEPAAPVTLRDAFFSNLCASVTAGAISGGPLAGDNSWAWAGEGRPADAPPRRIGDPPHEIPGWYSIYDADISTLLVLEDHAARMAVLSDDTDRDALPDSWETACFGATTNTSGDPGEDWDRDGFPDRSEYVAGTSPRSGSDFLAIRSVSCVASSQEFHIAWNSVSGRLYTAATAAAPGQPFADVPGFTDRMATGGVMTCAHPLVPGDRALFRVKVRPSPP